VSRCSVCHANTDKMVDEETVTGHGVRMNKISNPIRVHTARLKGARYNYGFSRVMETAPGIQATSPERAFQVYLSIGFNSK
ncbi:MAG: hypothetical protein K2X86_03950, partial [Cytophagaceae bacterium]|nr:hypothetical protein [Cytophagaceae bacterium]